MKLSRGEQKTQLVAGGAALLILAAAVWFLLISPKRSDITALESEITAATQRLADKRGALASPPSAVRVRATDLYRLTKALPDANDMSGIILDVNRLAARNNLRFGSLVPSTPVAGSGTLALPVTVTVQGRFASVSRFLGDIRKLVQVRDGLLDARGRLYSVSQIDLGQPDGGQFPVVKATVTLNAYAFSAPLPDVASPTVTTTPAGTVAAGVTP